MEIVMLVVGWALWGFALLLGLGVLASQNPDGGVRSMMRTQGFVLLVACAVTAFLPVSNFWLLVAFPVSFFLPRFLMSSRAAGAVARFDELQRESEATGVPLEDLLKRETERMQGREKLFGSSQTQEMDLEFIFHFQKLLAFQQLYMEQYNDALATVAGLGEGGGPGFLDSG